MKNVFKKYVKLEIILAALLMIQGSIELSIGYGCSPKTFNVYVIRDQSSYLVIQGAMIFILLICGVYRIYSNRQ